MVGAIETGGQFGLPPLYGLWNGSVQCIGNSGRVAFKIGLLQFQTLSGMWDWGVDYQKGLSLQDFRDLWEPFLGSHIGCRLAKIVADGNVGTMLQKNDNHIDVTLLGS